MSNQVNIVQNVDDSQMIRAFQSHLAMMEKIERRWEGQANAMKRGGQEGGKAFDLSAVSIGKWLAGLQLGRMALQSLRDEYQQYIRLQEEARQANLQAAGGIRGAKASFVEDASINRANFEPKLLELARRTGVAPEGVGNVLQDTLSAKGSATNQQAFDTVEAALRFMPDPAEARELAQRAIDVQNMTGVFDPRASLGFLQQIQTQARVTSVKQAGKAAVPAINAAMLRGDTAEQGGELFATLTSLAADAGGDSTSTAMIALANQLSEFKAKGAGAEQFNETKGVTNRILALQQNQELASQFLGGASFEQKLKPAIEELLTGSVRAVAKFEETRANIRPLTADTAGQQAQVFEDAVSFLEEGNPAAIARANRQGEAARNDFFMSTPAGNTAAIRHELSKTLEAADLIGLDTTKEAFSMAEFDASVAAGAQPGNVARGMLSRELEMGQNDMFGRQLSGESKALMEHAISVIEGLQQALEENTAATAENSQQTGGPGGAAGNRVPPANQLSRR